MTDVSEFFPDPSGLSRDVRNTLMHAARRHLKVSRVPLTRTQVADLFAEGFVGIPIDSRHEDDWFFTNEGLKMAAACGFFGLKPERSQQGDDPDKAQSNNGDARLTSARRALLDLLIRRGRLPWSRQANDGEV